MALAKGEGVATRPLSSRRMFRRLPNEEEIAAIDIDLVPSSIDAIAPILRAAKHIETHNPRVAYLCRFHAFEKAQSLDPTETGRGVPEFKTSLMSRLEMEEEITQPILAKSDPKELLIYYRKFYEDNIRDRETQKTPEEMAKLYQIAIVLYDVIKTIVPSSRIDEQTHRFAKEVERKNNILLQNQQLSPTSEEEVAGLLRRMNELDTKLGALELEERKNKVHHEEEMRKKFGNNEKEMNELKERIKCLELDVAEGKAELHKWKTENMNVVTRGIDGTKSLLHGLQEKNGETANRDLPVSADSQPLLATGDRGDETATPWWKNCCGVLDLFKISTSAR